ncbi:MAG TPA: hypothetical protein VGJ05_02555 [Fimbriiglobus sp.]|jgi:hypothetical protein
MPENAQPNWRGNVPPPPPVAGRPGGWRADTPAEGKGAGRKIRLFAIILGCVAAVAVGVWLVLHLKPPTVPTVVVVAAIPTNDTIDRLDVPPDVYGWLGAKALAKWTNEAGQGQQLAGTAPKLIWDGDHQQPYALHDAQWAWIEAIAADDRADPVVIYIGAHGTVDGDGDPGLYTGGVNANGKPGILKLRDILDKLGSGKLRDKKKVLILDPGRLPPNAAQGELVPLFVTRLKEIENSDKAFVGKCENLILVCGSGAGERGWDSELYGQSVFAVQLQKALTGEFVAQEGRSSYNALQLFQQVENSTTTWTKLRRPTSQTPILFPASNGRDLAEKMPLGIAITNPDVDADKSKSKPSLQGLNERWDKCQELIDSFPSQPPYAYAPRLWRRYRDLMIRYDGLVRAGQEKASFAVDLARKLDTMAARIEELGTLKLDASSAYSYAIPAALSLPGPEIPTARELLDAPGTDPQLKPSAHLARMLAARYRESKAVPANAVAMIETRLSSEQAILGILGGKTTNGAPYPERLWPLVDPMIQAADKDRRRGEDRLFGPPKQGAKDSYAEAGQLLKAANYAYGTAQRSTADPLRYAYQVRDRALADLPYYTAWAAEMDDEKLTVARGAWEKAHKLDDALAHVDPKRLNELKTEADQLVADIDALKERVGKVLSGSSAPLPSNWPNVENLLSLPPPLVPSADRKGLLDKAQTYLRSFDSQSGDKGVGTIEAGEQKKLATRRAVAGFASFPESDLRTSADRLPTETDWEKEALRLGRSLREKYRDLADKARFPAPPSTTEEVAASKATDREQARDSSERASRLAIPFARPAEEDFEPAAENRKARWQSVLEALALQAATDHWYDETGKPYFKNAAEAFLKDAARVRPPAPDGSVYHSPPNVERLLALERWTVSPKQVGPIFWTSERQRTFEFELKKNGWPADLEGFAACHVGLTEETSPDDLLKVGPALKSRDQLVPPTESALPKVPIVISEAEAVGTGKASVVADVYFRGQMLRTNTEISLQRRPEWVVSNVLPSHKEGAMIAIKSDDDVTPGAISIVLDLSGSMDTKAEGKTRHELAVNTLLDILNSFPEGKFPSVSLRVFGLHHDKSADQSVAAKTRASKIEQVFPRVGHPPARMAPADVAELKSSCRQLLNEKPIWFTPLVHAMSEGLRDGFPEDYSGPKTLLVLTDGMDTWHGEIVFKNSGMEKATSEAEKRAIIAKVKADVDELNRAQVPIHIVFFSANDGNRDQEDAEEAVAREQFSAVPKFKAPGQLWSAKDAKALSEKLAILMRPKPRLETEVGGALAEGIPPFGMPTNRPNDPPSALRWYGKQMDGGIKPEAGDYVLTLPGLDRSYRQRVAFSDGDRLLVRIVKTESGVRFRRELFYESYKPNPDRTNADMPRLAKTDDWLMAVPQNYIVHSNATASLSQMVGLEYRKDLDPGLDGTIKQIKPKLIWWDVSRSGPAEPTWYGRVENLSGYPTPTWQLRMDNWPFAAGIFGPYAEPKLKAWAVAKLSGLNPDPVFADRLTLPVSATEEIAGSLKDRTGRTVPIRVTAERVDVRTTTRERSVENVTRQPCVVVRIDYPKDRDVFAIARVKRKADGSPLVLEFDEHRYYRKANGYTAIFGPVSDNDVALGVEVEIELVSIPDLKAACPQPLVFDRLGPPNENDQPTKQPIPQRDVDFNPGRP